MKNIAFFKKLRNSYNTLLNTGISKTKELNSRKNLQLMNQYMIATILYLIVASIINIIDNTENLVFQSIILILIYTLNIFLTKYHKRPNITVDIFLFITAFILLFVIVTGGKQGISFITTAFFPVIVLQLRGLKRGTVYFILFYICEFLLMTVFVTQPWMFDYYGHYKSYKVVASRWLFLQLGLYIYTFISIKKQTEVFHELENVNSEKTSLFINLAKKTKSPLTIISHNLDKYINKHGLTPELESISANINKLKRDMINFLDIGKLEHNLTFYNHDNISDLCEIVKKYIHIFQEVAAKREISINFSSKCSRHFINCDIEALHRILGNLFDNAVKYSKQEGTVEIQLLRIRKTVQLIFNDNGIGMTESQMRSLFTPFKHEISVNSGIEGIGIGLKIVKKIMKELGGTIEVHSELKKGTIFILTFPECKTHEKENLITNNIGRSHHYSGDPVLERIKYDEEKFNLFFIESDKEMLSLLQNEFKNKYNVFFAVNGTEALSMLPEIPKPHIIISDVFLEEMDGYELYSKTKELDGFGSVPFLFLSEKTLSRERMKALAMGAVDYVSKPFSIPELEMKVETIININERIKSSLVAEINQDLNKYFSQHNFRNKVQKSKKNEIQILQPFITKYKISEKETDVILLLKTGFEYKEIAVKLNISINTVKTYMKRIFKKCQIQNSKELLNLMNISSTK